MNLLAAVILAALWTDVACAEEFLGIGPKSRLQDLRAQFPNARFGELKPAWLKPHQRLIDVAGVGIDGELAVKLEHEVEGTRLLAKEVAIRQARGVLEESQSFLLEGMPERLERLERSPPADPWEVKEIRWQPPNPIPIKAASQRYGVPDSDKTDEQFRRVVEWEKRGVTGYVNNEDQVTLFIYSFTIRDYLCAMRDPAPPACGELGASQSKPSKPAPKK